MAVNEESENPAEGPGRAAVLSTVLLVLIYMLVATAAQADAGTHYLSSNEADVLSPLGTRVFGSGILQKFLLFSVLTSASASTQTTILPTARTTISMASWGALPKAFARVHPRFLTPSFSTLMMGGVSIVWTVGLLLASTRPTCSGTRSRALGFAILFYYGFTGLFCVVYYRRELFKSWHRALLVGLVPLIGFVAMAYIFIKDFITVNTPGYNLTPPILGIQTPIVIGIGGLLLGLVVMVMQWIYMPDFFRRKPQTADPKILEEHLAPAYRVRDRARHARRPRRPAAADARLLRLLRGRAERRAAARAVADADREPGHERHPADRPQRRHRSPRGRLRHPLLDLLDARRLGDRADERPLRRPRRSAPAASGAR